MKLIRRIVMGILALLLLSGLLPGATRSECAVLSRELGVNCTHAVQEAYEDTHGGFLGDGTTLAAYRFSEDISNELRENQNWQPLPADEVFLLLVYGGEKDGVEYGAHTFDLETGETRFPKPQNGWYFFHNRQAAASVPYSTQSISLEKAVSWNYTAAVYDADTFTLTIFKIDT